MGFDDIIDFRGKHSSKWDTMESAMGVSPKDGLAMWVADMDFRPPECGIEAVAKANAEGLYTYFGDMSEYEASISWWMKERHGWTVDPKAIITTQGIVNAVAVCLDTYTRPGDGVVVFSPVYHAFHRVIRANDRVVVECPLVVKEDIYTFDFDAYDRQMTGAEKVVILCSPHNPGGRVWSAEELRGVADFARRHGLLLISDEIHHDLVFPGEKHLAMATVEPGLSDRLIMMSATSKTFNVAGMHCGNVIIADDALRAPFAKRMSQLSIAPNSMSLRMVPALYSPEGAAWVDGLNLYLAANHRLFRDGVDAIPGLRMMPMQGTYLAWVDFSGTGMEREEFSRRVAEDARIAASPGPVFGQGGDDYLRFNLAMPKARIEEALDRLRGAFRDLQ
ncbi:MAG: PatB family C-S lyase [Rhodobacteraceae bacterium]|nr:PatB family C-S lyase [Paracoccaceae bacterium]